MHCSLSLLWPGASQWRIYCQRMWGELSTTCSNVLKQPNGELLVVVNHNQLRTMASETEDPIYWSHPPPSWAVSPDRLVQSINQCKLSGNQTCNRSMRGNHLAYAATQGIKYIKLFCLIRTFPFPDFSLGEVELKMKLIVDYILAMRNIEHIWRKLMKNLFIIIKL